MNRPESFSRFSMLCQAESRFMNVSNKFLAEDQPSSSSIDSPLYLGTVVANSATDAMSCNISGRLTS
jgi:hypothetical protein